MYFLAKTIYIDWTTNEKKEFHWGSMHMTDCQMDTLFKAYEDSGYDDFIVFLAIIALEDKHLPKPNTVVDREFIFTNR